MTSERIQEIFEKRFGGGGVLFASPGRVNLIGEHTDYNLGFVLPGAIEQAIYAVIRPNETDSVRAYAADYDASLEFTLMSGSPPKPQWARYIYGVVQEMADREHKPGGFDCVFGGDVPLGAGLSSSAALESVFGFGLNELFSLGFSRFDLAKIGQMTEHHYIGVRCGIMDQFASLFGERGKVIRLDCRTLDYKLEPFSPVGFRLVLLDTQVKHSLASSQYNVRREQCEAGVAVVARHAAGVESLRDVTFDQLNTYQNEMDEVVYRRCKYIIEENERLLTGCEALERGDYRAFGQKMFGSHRGLSLDYEVSCEELDFLAGFAEDYPGVIGARMMGGGFGGCTINLVEEGALESFVDEALGRYEKRFQKAARRINVVIGNGASRWVPAQGDF